MVVKGRKTERETWKKEEGERGLSYILVVLHFNGHQNKLEGFLKHRLMGLTPRVLNADCLGWGM